MITAVEVRTNQGRFLRIPLTEISDGIIIAKIEGLEPVKATLVSTSFANMDGEQYHSSRREARDIKLTLELVPGFAGATVREIRNQLYGYFMPKTGVTLRFIMSDGLEVDIPGRVETFEAPMFVQEPMVDISVRCFNPDFVDLNSVIISGQSNPTNETTLIDYNGTVETGILFTLVPDRAVSAFSVYLTPPDGTLRTLDFSAPLEPGDVVQISSIPGNKYATVNKVTGISSILYAVSPQSSWLELMPGDNKLQVYAEGAPLNYNIEYTTKYGGL